jgi:hypothetical protein
MKDSLKRFNEKLNDYQLFTNLKDAISFHREYLKQPDRERAVGVYVCWIIKIK